MTLADRVSINLEAPTPARPEGTMAKQFYTVLVLPDATAPARKFHIRTPVVTGLAGALALAGCLLLPRLLPT